MGSHTYFTLKNICICFRIKNKKELTKNREITYLENGTPLSKVGVLMISIRVFNFGNNFIPSKKLFPNIIFEIISEVKFLTYSSTINSATPSSALTTLSHDLISVHADSTIMFTVSCNHMILVI